MAQADEYRKSALCRAVLSDGKQSFNGVSTYFLPTFFFLSSIKSLKTMKSKGEINAAACFRDMNGFSTWNRRGC